MTAAMDLSRLTQGERIVLAAGVLLIIDLLFLPWHSIDVPDALKAAGFDNTISGVQSPNSAYGVLAVLLTIIMVAQIIAAKLAGASLPEPPIPWSQIHVIAGTTVAILLVIKLIRETDSLGFGCYLGVLLGIVLAYGAYALRREDSILV
jgi:hypothetical protein